MTFSPVFRSYLIKKFFSYNWIQILLFITALPFFKPVFFIVLIITEFIHSNQILKLSFTLQLNSSGTFISKLPFRKTFFFSVKLRTLVYERSYELNNLDFLLFFLLLSRVSRNPTFHPNFYQSSGLPIQELILLRETEKLDYQFWDLIFHNLWTSHLDFVFPVYTHQYSLIFLDSSSVSLAEIDIDSLFEWGKKTFLAGIVPLSLRLSSGLQILLLKFFGIPCP
ncbi:MAG: hypothetical protein Ta2E_09890 [Mycoplasmoidaceae bacterium]|nr:MAG: hypothetical protein Ta2E_09890 [Mycoplasmoidaceae bacterium]